MHPICERPSDLTLQSPGPVTNYLPLPLCVLRQLVGQGSPLGWCVFHHLTRPNRKSSSAPCGCSWSKKRKFVTGLLPVRTGSREVLTAAAVGPRRGGASLVSYPSGKEVVKCSLWISWSNKRAERKPSSVHCGRSCSKKRMLGAGLERISPPQPVRKGSRQVLTGAAAGPRDSKRGVSHELLDRTTALVVETGPGLATVPEPASQPYRTTRKPSTTHKTRKSANAHCGCSCCTKRRTRPCAHSCCC